MKIQQEKALSVAALVCLLISIGLAILVAERVIAATWQWYKFAGHLGGGHISLSQSTGLFFVSSLAILLVVALVLNRLATRLLPSRSEICLRWVIRVLVATAVSYVLLGASILNVWRA